jgi:hypothetical protein
MTNGLAILGGYTVLLLLAVALAACLLRRSPCDDSEPSESTGGDRRL